MRWHKATGTRWRMAAKGGLLFCTLLLLLLRAPRLLAASQEITLSAKELTLVKGNTRVIEVKGTAETPKWSTSKSSVASVKTQDGVTVITAKKYGSAVITASVAGKTLTCTVTVVDPRVNKDSLYLLAGDSYILSAKRITARPKWSSEKPSVATVNSQGVVQAKAAGKTTIRMTAHGVTVEVPVTVATCHLGTYTLLMKEGESRQIAVSGSAKAGVWRSANDSRVAVSSSGGVQALKHGEVMLTYTVGDSELSCDVIVQKKDIEKSFALTPAHHNPGISSLRNKAFGSKSRYRFLQGSCTDGTYGYFLLEDYAYNGKCALIKFRLSDWKVVKKRAGLALGHGNDITYNKKKNRMIVAHNATGSTGGARKISYVKPTSLKVVSTASLDTEIYSIAYDAGGDRYVCGVSGGRKMVVKDARFATVREFDLLPMDSYTRQGIDCSSTYIYVVQSNMNSGKTRILMYDWNGWYVATVRFSGQREAESMFHVGKRVVLSYNSSSYNGGQVYETAFMNYYQVCYRPGGGKGVMGPRMLKVKKGLRLAANKYTRKGYTFAGWKMQRASDGKVVYRNKKTGKKKWFLPGTPSSSWKVYKFKNRAKVSALSKVAGDCITLTAQWEKN